MNIRNARKILCLSQEAFAKKLEVSVRTIGNWENGSVAVPPAKIEKIKELVANAPRPGDIIEIGDHSPGGGKNNMVNADLSEALLRAFDEIAGQRKLTEDALARLSKTQEQVGELLEILKSKIVK